MSRRQAAPGAPEGGLIVDKTPGPTSHDIVAIARRSLRQPRVGHAGTLDPMATGVLVLLLGRATRLAQFLGQDEKRYEAVVAFGQATSTCDAEGTPIGPRSETRVGRGALDAAIARHRGPQMQTPPAVSAKKVGGHRAYDLARAEKPVVLAPVSVELHEAEVVEFDGHRATLHVTCSAGYYVRALARDLGEALGIGAHLHALRRTRSGLFGLERAVTVEALAKGAAETLVPALLSPADLLAHLPTVVATGEGCERLEHGRTLEPGHLLGRLPAQGETKVVDQSGRLLAIAKVGRGALHPVVVLR
jgi:tRNA pseudouridine55 synthase